MNLRDYLPAIYRGITKTIKNYIILSFQYGQYKTIYRWNCIDRHGKAIPWYTYPAIEYIKQLDFSEKTIFEYGSGNSSIFWAYLCKKLISIEDKQKWYEKINKSLPDNAEYNLINNKEEYIKAIEKYPDKFDVIIIDGSYRHECALVARKKLRDDGFIILDNSDWFVKTSLFLRDTDLIEVDMSGFGPINNYTWTTSFYFTRNVKLKPSLERQPINGIGSIYHIETE